MKGLQFYKMSLVHFSQAMLQAHKQVAMELSHAEIRWEHDQGLLADIHEILDDNLAHDPKLVARAYLLAYTNGEAWRPLRKVIRIYFIWCCANQLGTLARLSVFNLFEEIFGETRFNHWDVDLSSQLKMAYKCIVKKEGPQVGAGLVSSRGTISRPHNAMARGTIESLPLPASLSSPLGDRAMWEIMHVYTELRCERDQLIHELAAASGGNLRHWSAYFCIAAIHECDPEAVAIAYVWLLTYAEHCSSLKKAMRSFLIWCCVLYMRTPQWPSINTLLEHIFPHGRYNGWDHQLTSQLKMAYDHNFPGFRSPFHKKTRRGRRSRSRLICAFPFSTPIKMQY